MRTLAGFRELWGRHLLSALTVLAVMVGGLALGCLVVQVHP